VTRVLAAALATLLLAAPLPDAERRKIEALIAAVERLQDATFVRNGKAYDAATAAKFLRGKWDSRSGEIASAEDFIARVATFSSTSGRPYLIRFADGREVPAADFFRGELARLSDPP
jgi:hypothetical protein